MAEFHKLLKERVQPIVNAKAKEAGNLNKTAEDAETLASGKKRPRPSDDDDEDLPIKKQKV